MKQSSAMISEDNAMATFQCMYECSRCLMQFLCEVSLKSVMYRIYIKFSFVFALL